MEQEKLELMAQSYREADKVIYDFFVFHEEAKIQLLSNQSQLLQYLTSVNLAFVTIVIATQKAQINLLWGSSFIASLILIVISTAYVREVNDSMANSLDKESQSLKSKQEQILGIIIKNPEAEPRGMNLPMHGTRAA